MRRQSERNPQRGFTLIELLVVIAIIGLVSALAIAAVLTALPQQRITEAARIFQSVLVGARDAAIRANAIRGVRLLPDPIFSPQQGTLASNRFIPIEPAPDYSEGQVHAIPPQTAPPVAIAGLAGPQFLQVVEVVTTNVGTSAVPINIPNPPTGWYFNIRQGDKIRLNDSGRYYTVAGPMQLGPSFQNQAKNTGAAEAGAGENIQQNAERFVNDLRVNVAANLGNMNVGIPSTTLSQEYLNLVNGQDDDGDGWVDEGFDGIDNDGDGIIDPGYNGLDDDGDGVIDNPAELQYGVNHATLQGGEFEQEQFIGANSTTPITEEAYVIVRRPIATPNSRETVLPDGVVIDLTTWNSPSLPSPSLPERSRVPVDPYTGYVDILVAPSGQIVTSGGGSTAIDFNLNSPSSNLPFYHFWLTDREGVVPPIWSLGSYNATTGIYVSNANPNYPSQTYLLPMPQGTLHYNAGTLTPYLTGQRRLVTLFTKTGQIVTNSIEFFDGNDTNRPFYDAQAGIKEAQ